jgi:hypothetical protein
MFGLLPKSKRLVTVVDSGGVVKLKINDGAVYEAQGERLEHSLKRVLNRESVFSNSSTKLPNIYVCHGNQILDASGMSTRDQLLSLVNLELEDVPNDQQLLILAEKP